MRTPSRRVHIVGVSPRTGTTLLAESMAVCFDFQQTEAHEKSCNRLRWVPGSYLTKSPRQLDLVGPRLQCDRRFWVICLVRDPRDVIVSRHGRNPNRYWAPLHIWKRGFEIQRTLQSHDRFLTLRYEDLVNTPDLVQNQILKRLPFLKKKHNFSEFHKLASPSNDAIKALGSVRPITPASIGNWKKHLPRVARQIDLHGNVTSELVQLGYEADDSWELVLNNVSPDIVTDAPQDKKHSIRKSLSRKLTRAYPLAVRTYLYDRLNVPFV